MQSTLLFRVLIALAVYLGLSYFGGEIGYKILYPVRMLVTFLHEFGHALGAILTGGSVDSLEVRPDGSGVTWTRGGSRSITLMGGYIGSAIFGNILFYIGAKAKPQVAKFTIYGLAVLMVAVGLYWFTSLFTTGLLLAFAVACWLIARYTRFDSDVLIFFGLACILYIIQDFNVGPSSDLEMYARDFIVLPASAWMYIWLSIVVVLFAWNLRTIFRSRTTSHQVQG